jgi:hypothetical protein
VAHCANTGTIGKTGTSASERRSVQIVETIHDMVLRRFKSYASNNSRIKVTLLVQSSLFRQNYFLSMNIRSDYFHRKSLVFIAIQALSLLLAISPSWTPQWTTAFVSDIYKKHLLSCKPMRRNHVTKFKRLSCKRIHGRSSIVATIELRNVECDSNFSTSDGVYFISQRRSDIYCYKPYSVEIGVHMKAWVSGKQH